MENAKQLLNYAISPNAQNPAAPAQMFAETDHKRLCPTSPSERKPDG